MRFCSKCGIQVNQDDDFCFNCGCRLNQIDRFNNDRFSGFYDENKNNIKGYINRGLIKKTLAILVVFICVSGLVFFVNFLFDAYSPENRLMKNEWWAETRFENSECRYGYGNSDEMIDGYSSYGVAKMVVFCEYGTIRVDKYVSEYCYSQNGLSAANCSSRLSWDCRSNNDTLWKILDDNVLVVDEEKYTWSDDIEEDTWYLTNGKLRIGNEVFTTSKPSYVKDTYDVPPYWCERCGQQGPYARECPECEYDEQDD